MSLDIMKARAVIALIIGAGVWGLVAFLQERAVFEPVVFTVLAALSFAVQTAGRGLPVRLPHRFDGSIAELRKSVGEPGVPRGGGLSGPRRRDRDGVSHRAMVSENDQELTQKDDTARWLLTSLPSSSCSGN